MHMPWVPPPPSGGVSNPGSPETGPIQWSLQSAGHHLLQNIPLVRGGELLQLPTTMATKHTKNKNKNKTTFLIPEALLSSSPTTLLL